MVRFKMLPFFSGLDFFMVLQELLDWCNEKGNYVIITVSMLALFRLYSRFTFIFNQQQALQLRTKQGILL